MGDILLVYLSEDKKCLKCEKTIKQGEKAIRKNSKETRSSPGRNEFYHTKCWEGK